MCLLVCLHCHTAVPQALTDYLAHPGVALQGHPTSPSCNLGASLPSAVAEYLLARHHHQQQQTMRWLQGDPVAASADGGTARPARQQLEGATGSAWAMQVRSSAHTTGCIIWRGAPQLARLPNSAGACQKAQGASNPAGYAWHACRSGVSEERLSGPCCLAFKAKLSCPTKSKPPPPCLNRCPAGPQL